MSTYLNNSGHLDVGDGHKIYWEDWGNPKATPIFHLHGGPGANFHDGHKEIYDPAKHRVIFHDQRGCGRSTPFASTDNNTTQDLVSDIEKLREQLGIEKLYLAGGSWGSTLSLVYAISHPNRVKAMMIWSIYLATHEETEFVNTGGPSVTFPEAWERFIKLVPETDRTSGDSIMKYYAKQMRSSDKTKANQFAFEWTLWEATLLSMNYQPKILETELKEDPRYLSTALLETHYFLNNCFIPNNYILKELDKIKDVPCYIIHGRFDMCTPPLSAYKLANAYGDKANLQWVISGHLRSEPEMLKALKATASSKLAN